LGSGDNIIEGVLASSEEEHPEGRALVPNDDADEEVHIDPADQSQAPLPKPKTARKSLKNHAITQFLGRPADMGTPE
jgi:hypothetical protein